MKPEVIQLLTQDYDVSGRGEVVKRLMESYEEALQWI